MKEIKKQDSSYRLDIIVMPNWDKLYKKLCDPKSEEEFEKMLEEKNKKWERMILLVCGVANVILRNITILPLV